MHAAMPLAHQPDCEEKRDPDERKRPKRKKENELDPNTQLEKADIGVSVTIGARPKLGLGRPLAQCVRSIPTFEGTQSGG